MSLSRFVATPETRSARLAVERVAADLIAGSKRRAVNPLFLVGPPGTGKTHLANGLVEAVTAASPPRTALLLPAADLLPPRADGSDVADPLEGAWACDLLIVEDLQHLPARSAGVLERLFDHRLSRQRQMVFTATAGPAQLANLPPRLTSRLAGGLVVALEPLAAPSRYLILYRLAQDRQLTVAPGILDWVAEQTPGGVRPLLGALTTLEALARTVRGPLDLPTVERHWAEGGTPAGPKPTLERIAQRVGLHFRLDPKELRHRDRQPRLLWPSQVGMFLARELTGLPLPRIGGFFGGRDPSTVRHACRKVEEAVERDPAVAGALRQLRAELA